MGLVNVASCQANFEASSILVTQDLVFLSLMTGLMEFPVDLETLSLLPLYSFLHPCLVRHSAPLMLGFNLNAFNIQFINLPNIPMTSPFSPAAIIFFFQSTARHKEIQS
jgi:hypothetical protein